MAKVIDDVLEDNTITNSLDDPIIEEEQPKVEPAPVDEDIPEKYRGKTAKEIAMMHQEAEKLIGRQGSEVGELRKVVDDFIKAQTSKDLKTVETDVSDEDIFIDPKSAINKMVDNHPAVKEAQQAAIQMKRQEVLGRLQSEYPNIADTVNSEAFREWIKGSKVRTELMIRAEAQLDYDSAKELMDTWNERQAIAKKVTESSKLDRESQLKAADTSVSSSTESVPKKKYRRSDIIKLMQTDPDRYNALSNEIMAAYAEGRVI